MAAARRPLRKRYQSLPRPRSWQTRDRAERVVGCQSGSLDARACGRARGCYAPRTCLVLLSLLLPHVARLVREPSLTWLVGEATAGPAGRTGRALDFRRCVRPSHGIPLPGARRTAHRRFRRTVLANVRTVRT